MIEFATDKAYWHQANSLQTYLGRLNPNDYFFIGRTEKFGEDLAKLGGNMNWRIQSSLPYINRGRGESFISEKDYKILRQKLDSEFSFYNQLLETQHSKWS